MCVMFNLQYILSMMIAVTVTHLVLKCMLCVSILQTCQIKAR